MHFLFDDFRDFMYHLPMSSRLIYEANEVLRDLKSLKKRFSGQLADFSSYSGWILTKEGRRTPRHEYYDVFKPGSEKRSYLGNEKNADVLNVKRYRYAEEAIAVLDSNIRLLEDLIANYVSPVYQTINERLPVTYRTAVSSSFSASSIRPSDKDDMHTLLTEEYSGISIPGYYASLPREVLDWKLRLEKEKAKYPPYKPEQLIHPALDGTMMRSKSEVIIANILLLAGIPFVYELPMKVRGEMLLPDFTILSAIDYRTVIIIEHQGMMYIDNYAWKHIKSVRTYLRSDLIPNKNLFFTYDNANKIIDPRQVESILVKFVKPSLDISQLNFAFV